MNCILKYTFKLLNRFFPPIKFYKKFFEEELQPTDEDLDKWASEYLEKLENERRQKRGKHKN